MIASAGTNNSDVSPARSGSDASELPASAGPSNAEDPFSSRSQLPEAVDPSTPSLNASIESPDQITALASPRTAHTTLVQYGTSRAPLKPRLMDPDGALQRRCKRRMTRHKIIFQLGIVLVNAFFIFFTWYFLAYWYILIALVALAVTMNTIQITSVLFRTFVYDRIWPPVRDEPPTPESLILLLPCYNETLEELNNSLESLLQQRGIDNHKQAIAIICDGRVRGPGMTKSTAETLLQDVLTDTADQTFYPDGYTAWDQTRMPITLRTGRYRGIPYMCMIKDINQGKRDSLVVIRTWLHNFNLRNEAPCTIIHPDLFDQLATFLLDECEIEKADRLIGMDADTVLDPMCVYELVQECRLPKTSGVAGYVVVDWKDSPWSLWRLFQNCEYTVTQTVRRLHQGRVTHKVSVLPGACQILAINDDTCGDEVLVHKFGTKPDLDAGLYRQIMASASEDGNHICCMMTTRPHARARQTLKAKAYTDVPHSWPVYLSQRRRWSLGASCNDWLLVISWPTMWFERLVSLSGTLTWSLTPFIFATYSTFIYILVVHATWKVLAFASLMIIPLIYYFALPFWLMTTTKERCQFLVGLLSYLTLGPPCRFIVMLYSIWNMDELGWGKTRIVIADESEKGETPLAPERAMSEKENPV